MSPARASGRMRSVRGENVSANGRRFHAKSPESLAIPHSPTIARTGVMPCIGGGAAIPANAPDTFMQPGFHRPFYRPNV